MIKKQSGIGLLELMLSLAIIAVLLLMATRYFQPARMSQQTNEAVAMLQAVANAGENWKWTYGSYKTSTVINIKNMVNEGMLPNDFVKNNVNPWGGGVAVRTISNQQILISLSNVPQSACNELVQLMQRHNFKGSCAGKMYNAIYPSDVS